MRLQYVSFSYIKTLFGIDLYHSNGKCKFSYTERGWSWMYNVFGEVFSTGLPFNWGTAEQIFSKLSFSPLGVRRLWISEIGRTGSFSLAKIFEVCFLSFPLDRYIKIYFAWLLIQGYITYGCNVDAYAYVDVDVDVCHKNAIYVKEIQTPLAVWPARLSPLSLSNMCSIPFP